MISAIYAALAGLFIFYTSFNVIKVRKKFKISLGDGGNSELIEARSVHSNSTEYLPILILLLILFEMNNGYTLLVHLLGILIIAGRVFHFYGITKNHMQGRVWGMMQTFTALLILSVLNLILAII